MTEPEFAPPPTTMSDADHAQLWKQSGPIQIRMIEKIGDCEHELGATFEYNTP